MIGIIGVVAVLTVLWISLFVTRLAAIALALTGLSWEAARFQARSAFTGTGFTTREAEKVVNHPVRRKIIMLLMVTRSAGLISIIISLILSFGGSGEESERLYRLMGLIAGIIVLWFVAKSRYVDRYLTKVIEWALARWTDLNTKDYESLLKLSGEYTVKELAVKENDWLAEKNLRDCRLVKEGIIVLGIYRDSGDYIGAPKADTKIYPDDQLILYGRARNLKELDQRRKGASGEKAHEEGVSEQDQVIAEQENQERHLALKRSRAKQGD